MDTIKKQFNITAQVYKNNDASKQNLLINQTIDADCSEKALNNFKLNFPKTEYNLVKVLSVEKLQDD